MRIFLICQTLVDYVHSRCDKLHQLWLFWKVMLVLQKSPASFVCRLRFFFIVCTAIQTHLILFLKPLYRLFSAEHLQTGTHTCAQAALLFSVSLSLSFFRLPPPSFRKNVSLGTQDPILRLKYHRQSSPSIFPSPSPPLSCLSICQPDSSPPPAAVSGKQTGPLCPSVPAVPRLLPPWSHLPPAQGTTHLSSCSLRFFSY